MMFKRIVRTFALTSLFALTAHTANAQDLLARQAPIDRRAKALDTMVISRLRESEEVEEPASELYNDWNNNYAHRGGNLPDVWTLKSTSVIPSAQPSLERFVLLSTMQMVMENML